MVVSVQQTTDNFTVEDLLELTYDEPRVEATKVPEFQFKVKNKSGIPAYTLANGKEVRIDRHGIAQFPGIIDSITGMQDGNTATTFTVKGTHKGYHLLKSNPCSHYVFDENNDPVTTRDNVVVNPWRYFIFRDRRGALDVRGDSPIVDGVLPDDAIKCLIGTKFISQVQFDDNRYLLPASLTLPTYDTTGGSYEYPILKDSSGGSLHLYEVGGYTDTLTSHAAAQSKYGNGLVIHPTTARHTLVTNGKVLKAYGDMSATAAFTLDDLAAKHGILWYRAASDRADNFAVYIQPTTGKVFYRHTSTDNTTYTSESATGIASGFHTMTMRRDSTARTVVIKVDGVTLINATYTALQAPKGTATNPYAQFSPGRFYPIDNVVPLDHAFLKGKIYEIRIWNSLIAQATLDTVSDPASNTYKMVPVGTEHLFYQFDGVSANQVQGSGRANVHRSSELGDRYPVLRQTSDGTTDGVIRPFHQAIVESIALVNGDPNIKRMGIISSASITILGRRTGSPFEPVVGLARDALTTAGLHNAVRTYVAVTLARVDNYLGTTMSKWTGSVTFSGSETNKDAGAWRIEFPAQVNGGTANTSIEYVRADFVKANDTGITAGTIDAYTDPLDSLLGIKYIETDLLNKNRLEGIEHVRTLTESDAASNSSPHWDFWIDSNLAAHFKARRGAVIARTYSFANSNLRVLSHERFGKELAYQTIAYGAGSGEYQTRIVSKQEWSAGGLYDVNRDPAGGALYGNQARVLSFIDNNEKSVVSLLRKARAFHKLHRDPQEKIEIEVMPENLPYFATGDSITISNLPTRTNSAVRIVEVTRTFTGNAFERCRIVLGENPKDVFAHMVSTTSKVDTATLRQQPQAATTGLSGDGVYCDSSNYGIYSFAIPDGAIVERVLMQMTTLPWSTHARGAAGATAPSGRSDFGHTFVQGSTIPGSASSTYVYVHPPAPPSFATGGRSGTVATATIVNMTGSSQSYTVEFYLGPKGAGGTLLATFSSNIAHNNSWAPSVSATVQSAPAISSSAIYAYVTAGTIGTSQSSGTLGSFRIERFDYFNHVHEQEFGIYQFPGDGIAQNVSTAAYGVDIVFAVDPTVNAANLPTTFTTERQALRFGKSGGSVTVEYDITNFMSADVATGRIKGGEHRLYFQGSSVSGNGKGLAVVSCTPVIRYKSGG